MKMWRLYFLFVILFASCVSNSSKKDIHFPAPVAYSVIEKSKLFNDKTTKFQLDSVDKTLIINLDLFSLKNIGFPINREFKDTLTKTVFNFEFYNNGKLISSEYNKLKNTLRWINDSTDRVNQLIIQTDAIDFKYGNNVSFKLPFYAFHNLKKGKQTIELKMYQTFFVGDTYVDGKGKPSNHFYYKEEKQLFSATVKFDLYIPEIYKTIVYGYGLELRNDSTFSPAGMDNTIWNSSYPDIYWCIYYPKNEFYVQTVYETSTDRYVGHDTFNLFHYAINDSIGFGVYDHDNLSRDDFMGYWWGSINDLKKSKIRRIKFDNIKQFDVSLAESKSLE